MKIISYFKEPFKKEREKNIILGVLLFPVILLNFSFALAWANDNTNDIAELAGFISGKSPEWIYATVGTLYLLSTLYIYRTIKKRSTL